MPPSGGIVSPLISLSDRNGLMYIKVSSLLGHL